MVCDMKLLKLAIGKVASGKMHQNDKVFFFWWDSCVWPCLKTVSLVVCAPCSVSVFVFFLNTEHVFFKVVKMFVCFYLFCFLSCSALSSCTFHLLQQTDLLLSCTSGKPRSCMLEL